MPAFWGYPPPPHDYPHYWGILDPKSKYDKVKVTNLKNLPKFQIIVFWKKQHTWHTFWSCLIRCANMKRIQQVFLDREQTRFCPQRDRQTDRQTDRRTRWNQFTPPFNFIEAGDIMNTLDINHWNTLENQIENYNHISKGPISNNERGTEVENMFTLGPFYSYGLTLNLSMDKKSHAHLSVRLNYLSNPKLQWLHCWSLWMNK